MVRDRQSFRSSLSSWSKCTVVLWLSGVREALQLQRCVRFFLENHGIFEKASLCFLLNVCIFTGSIAFLRFVLEPTFRLLLSLGLAGGAAYTEQSSGAAGRPHGILGQALHRLPHLLLSTLWLLPMYLLSLLVSCSWYSEIARLAHEAQQERRRQQRVLRGLPEAPPESRRAPVPLSKMLADELYKMLLLTAFFAQATAASFVPLVGWLLYFLMTSMLYALYCFDYKWSLDKVDLSKRIAAVECNWPFFMGFGAPCVLLSLLLPFYAGAGVVNFVFPLFVLVACDTDVLAATQEGRRLAAPRRVRWFYPAQMASDAFAKAVAPK
mmetsp:Transcript_19216/g.45837  ORF Transcript_19216/g.45837 Transcript_19216/m.45837 type:complete len:324 (-) Transcript_19216:345-1316(-)